MSVVDALGGTVANVLRTLGRQFGQRVILRRPVAIRAADGSTSTYLESVDGVSAFDAVIVPMTYSQAQREFGRESQATCLTYLSTDTDTRLGDRLILPDASQWEIVSRIIIPQGKFVTIGLAERPALDDPESL
jgi:hypothetical protein